MTCEELIKKLYLYLDGELPPEEEVEVENHLAECITCLRLYGLELQFKKMIRSRLQTEEVPVELVESIRIALHLDSKPS